MRVVSYFKRLIKYVLYDYKQPKIYANLVQSSKNEVHLGKTYFITGGGSGLGYYMAKSLINSGARVIISGRNEDKLKIAQNELGNNCEYIVLDVCDINKSKTVMKDLFHKYGVIDGLVNNAGISLHEKNILDVSIENFDKQINTNLKGAYFLCQFYVDNYLKNKQTSGNILFISSERGAMCDDLPYGLTKVAINSLTQALSRRYYGFGIRVNSIGPGVTCSDLNKIDPKGDLYSDRASNRAFIPEEMAEIVNFILSDASKCISGENINCDAGNHIRAYFDK